MILSCDQLNCGPIPFKVFDDWLNLDEAQNIEKVLSENVHKSWFATMKEVKLGLKSWRSEKGGISDPIHELEQKVQLMDNEEGNTENKIKIFEQLQYAY